VRSAARKEIWPPVVKATSDAVPRREPFLAVFIPLEGRPRAMLVCESFEDEQRLAFDLAGRALLQELIDAVLALAEERAA
jgi:hypothetical protein